MCGTSGLHIDGPLRRLAVLSVAIDWTSLFVGGGLEGYLVTCRDVCVGVEALVCCCCSCPFSLLCQGLRVSAGAAVSSLILGEMRCSDFGEIACCRGFGFNATSLRSGIRHVVRPALSAAASQPTVCSQRMSNMSRPSCRKRRQASKPCPLREDLRSHSLLADQSPACRF